MNCYVKIKKDTPYDYLKFDYSENDHCCGQSIIGGFSYVTLNQAKSAKVGATNVRIFDNWDSFIIEMCIGEYNSNTITSIICTDIDGSDVYMDLVNLGFTSLSTFVNCKTGNTVHNLEYIIDHGYTFEEEVEEDDY